MPPPPTMFGAYISNVSSSVSWGDNATCTITIVEDEENGVFARIPSPGTPASIQLGSFYFGGILQRWTYQESLSGRTYDVILESPAKLLDGVQIILGEFNGSIVGEGNRYQPYAGGIFTNQLQNIYNVFGYFENPAIGDGGYGSSYYNSAGMPARKVLDTIQLLASGGGGAFGNKMNLGGYFYSLDLGELKSYISDNFRLAGPVQSLSSIIQECCDLAGLDYMVEQRNRVIRIRTISRGSVSNPNAVSNLVNSWTNSGILISKQIGNEFSAPVTQKLVVGGRVSRLLVNSAKDTYPVWGKKANSEYVFGLGNPTPMVYSTPSALVPILLDEYTGSTGYTATIMELRMATGGKDTWETFKAFETMYGVERNGYNNPASSPWYSKIGADINIFNALSDGTFTSFDLENTSFLTAEKRNSGYLNAVNDKIWAAVNRVASEFYGQVFLLKLDTYEPGGESGNVRWVTDEYVKQHVWDIADSAFDPRPLFTDPSFYDNEGRVRGGCAWPQSANFDYSALGSDWTTTPDGGIATTKGGPDKEIYYIDDEPYVIVRSGGTVLSYDGITTPDFGLSVLVWYFTNQFIHPAFYMTSGANNVQISIPPLPVPPFSFGVPQQSTTYCWGPWWAWSGSGSSVGLSECEFDADLRPEVFGSASALDQAGFAAATAGLARTSSQETGQVELVGLPFANIGDMLGGGPYINSISINVGVDQISTTYSFSSWTPEFGKLSQVNIARMKKIRKGALALVQSNRSKITRQPFPKRPFNKSSMAQLSQGQGTTARPNITMIHGFFNNVVAEATGQSGLTGDPQSYNIGQ